MGMEGFKSQGQALMQPKGGAASERNHMKGQTPPCSWDHGPEAPGPTTGTERGGRAGLACPGHLWGQGWAWAHRVLGGVRGPMTVDRGCDMGSKAPPE